MPRRQTFLGTDEYYHVFNRGVARQPIFINRLDYKQAILTLSYYRFSNPLLKLSRFKKLSLVERSHTLDRLMLTQKHVEIIAFVLMPNHFHFLLRQSVNEGISHFINKFSNSYAKYFNTKYKREGPLFQGRFKTVHVESDEQLLHLSRYIHLNPVVSSIVRGTDLSTYSWSSLPDFLQGQSELVNLNPVLQNFKTPQDYKKFVLDNVDYGKKLHFLKHLALE